MKKQLSLVILLGLLLSLTSVNSFADYQVEISAALGTADLETPGGDEDGDLIGLFAEFNFLPIDTGRGPLAEASFLTQSSLIQVSHVELDFDNGDSDTTVLAGRIVTDNGFIVEASYQEVLDADTISIGLGTYLTDELDLVVSFSDSNDNDTSTLSAAVHGLTPLSGGATLAYDVTLGYVDADSDNGTEIGGGITFYPSNNLGLSASYNRVSVDNGDVDTLSLGVDYFISEAFRVGASFQTVDLGSNLDIDVMLINGAYRF